MPMEWYLEDLRDKWRRGYMIVINNENRAQTSTDNGV